jgi:hypothetical protein
MQWAQISATTVIGSAFDERHFAEAVRSLAHVDLGNAVRIAGEPHFLACEFRRSGHARARFHQKFYRRHRLETRVPDANGVVP